LFEPSTSEHVSARTIFDPITAIGPSSDCKTYAIGYNNGSILLASLQPSFTILHTLMTSRAPSPIASLSWHASSSKQKSDMLATQSADGDLRVWSVSKPPTAEPPRVIRVLRRPEPTFIPGRTWISWSKNGRIIQFSESETCAWDVRTKHVTFEALPIVDGVRAMAAYGPTATLFSLGPDHTVQQYDAESYHLVKNVRQVPTHLPPTPPEENRPWTNSESEEEYRSPGGMRSRPEAPAHDQSRNRASSPRSQPRGSAMSQSVKPSSRGKDLISPAVRSELTGTTFSAGTQPNFLQGSQKYDSPTSARSSRKPSRLKQEVVPSPLEKSIDDLFPYIRARLSDVPYRPPRTDSARMTPDDLRNQMLNTVFGWEEDIWEMIRDELSRHPADSPHALFLSRWLDEDPDYLNTVLGSTGPVTNTDWMILALGIMDHEASAKKVCQVFIEKMLSRGDIHAAATVLLAIGDKSDAIEVYVSRNRFLEAVLLTCLLTPTDWQRQSHLVRRWGEHVVEKSEQQLAIRCFSCTSVEPTEPWTSPTAQMATQSAGGMKHPLLVPQSAVTLGQYPDIYEKTMRRRRPLEAPTPIAMPAPEVLPTPIRTAQHSGSRVTPQSSALKLITSFGPSATQQYKFPGLKSDDHTPTYGATVTPIAESAIDRSALSPGGTGNYRLNNLRSLNTAMSARTPSAYHRQRLPSIGETPIDVEAPSISQVLKGKRSHMALPTPADSGSEKERAAKEQQPQEPQSAHPALTLLTPARYEPAATPVHETPQTALPQTAVKTNYKARRFSGNDIGMDPENEGSRGSSRSRKPDGLSIQMYPVKESSQPSAKLPTTSESFSTTQIDTSTSDWTSPPVTGESRQSMRSPSTTGKSIDEYISSLQQAQLYGQNPRSRGQSSSSRHARDAASEKRSRHSHHSTSEDLRRHDDRRTIPAAKRSPSSPVPMSPEDVRMFSASVDSLDSYSHPGLLRTGTPGSHSGLGRRQSRSEKEGKRQRSKSSQVKNGSRAASKSRQASPDPAHHSLGSRGRSASRKEGSGRRSPSSPLPMVPSEEDRNSGSDPALRFVTADRRHRSTSTRGSRERSSKHDHSPGRQKSRNRSGSRQADDREGGVSRRSSVSTRDGKHRRRREASNARSDKNEKSMIDPQHAASHPTEPGERPAVPSLSDRKKELAAAELEARRLSLARRPSAPNIPLPGQHGGLSKSIPEGQAPPLLRSVTEDILTNKSYGESRMRRPSTPRAMQVLPDVPTESATDTDTNETLPSSVYMTPNPSMPASSPPPAQSQRTQPEFEAILAQLPRHPAYDTKITQSRSSSKSRDARESSRSRQTSRDRTKTVELISPIPAPTPADPPNGHTRRPPPLLPELQHLASPPIPPPAPGPHTAPMESRPNALQLDPEYIARLPRPSSSSAHARPNSPPSAGGHKRGRSGNGDVSGSFAGKFRSLTERMRSTSRGRNDMSKSPPVGYENGVQMHQPMPYETDTAGGPRVLAPLGRVL
jgi:hypothetical protein